MKFIITFFLVGWTLLLQSQPALTSLNEASIGNTFTYVFVDTTGIQPGSSGAAQTWDFSTVTASGLSQVDSWVAPSATPYASSYPASNIVQQTDNGSGAIVYLYHNLTGTETQLEGIATDFSGINTTMIYSNTEILRQYPATYNSAVSDSYAGEANQNFGPLTATTYRNGTYEYVVDGYGNLITPVASFPNTLRIRLRQVFTDSTVYTGNPIPPIIQHSYSTTYFWASADAGNKLYQFYIGYDTLVTIAATTASISASYQDDATGITESGNANSGMVVTYPIPASDLVSISIENPVNGTAELWLYDIRGNLVKRSATTMHKANHFEWTLPLTDLCGGLYFGKINCADKYWMVKIMKK